uniref:Peptidase S1 domain-containing protein n=1 Tax=Erpetoichthys calabaricus TaxID=27687 RepID=A0A8C4SPM2_ERPCA
MLPINALCLFIIFINVGRDKIIGGHKARPHSHHYMAYLTMIENNGCFSFCGDVLIHKDFIMTAAHCNASKRRPTKSGPQTPTNFTPTSCLIRR